MYRLRRSHSLGGPSFALKVRCWAQKRVFHCLSMQAGDSGKSAADYKCLLTTACQLQLPAPRKLSEPRPHQWWQWWGKRNTGKTLLHFLINHNVADNLCAGTEGVEAVGSSSRKFCLSGWAWASTVLMHTWRSGVHEGFQWSGWNSTRKSGRIFLLSKPLFL